MLQFSLRTLIVAATMLVTVASAEERPRDRLAFLGTERANKRIESLKLSPEEAASEVTKFLAADKLGKRHYVCCFLLDNEYVFSHKLEKARFPVTGVYVDGITGRIRRVGKEDIGAIYMGILSPKATFLPSHFGDDDGYDGEFVENP